MASSQTPTVRVGVALFILHETSTPTNPVFLLGQRKGSHGSGTLALPGGHLEFSETISTCAAREALEETGLEVIDITFLTATDDYMESEGKHYVTMWMVGRRKDEGQEAVVLEREKCEGWEWCEWRTFEREVESRTGRKWVTPMENLLTQRPGLVPKLM